MQLEMTYTLLLNFFQVEIWFSYTCRDRKIDSWKGRKVIKCF